MDTKMNFPTPFCGNWKVDASRAYKEVVVEVEKRLPTCRKASCTSLPKHATSPVLLISTPKVGSAPRSRVKENIGALTAT